jgi:hypothetical protein
MDKKARSVLSFDGFDDLVEVARHSEQKIAKNLTIEAWVFPCGRTHYAGIVSRVFDTGAIESGYGLLLDNGGGFYGAVKVTGQGYQYLSSGANTVPGNDWHHLAMTWDGQQLLLYVDGERKAAYACAGTNLHYDPEHEVTIGAYRDNDERYHFSGKIAEVRLWNVTRTAKQISDDRFVQLAGSEPGLVGYWPLDEGSGVSVADRTKQGSHGKISGATWEKVEAPFAGKVGAQAATPTPSLALAPNHGVFNTQEVRPWNEPRPATSKEIAFSRPLPAVALGLTSLDVLCNANVRVKTYADHITSQGFAVHADSWGDTVLCSAGCSWLEVGAHDPGFQCGVFNTMEDHPWDKPQQKTARQIQFARPYAVPPKVVVWLNSVDLSSSHNWRVKVLATDVTTTGFVLHIESWADSVLYTAGATWIALPADRPGLCTGTFNTMEVRSWDKPQHNHSKAVSFQGLGFSSAPRVVLGLNSLDFDCRRNLRVNLTAEGISAAGMTLNLNSWADTVMYSAGGSYILIG